MAKEYAKGFYNSVAWKNTRNAYYKSKSGMCERCQKEFEEGKRSLKDINIGSTVHHKRHITPKNINDPRVTLSWDNLEVLCDEHHAIEHRGKPKRYRYDKDGNIIPTKPFSEA